MRNFNWKFLESIANRPDIRPNLGGEGPVPLEAMVMNPSNYCFTCPIGGFILVRVFDKVYEAHSLFIPERKGANDIVQLMRLVQAYMFTNTDCDLIMTKIPRGNKGAANIALVGRFKSIGWDEQWNAGHGAEVMHFPLDTWARVCYSTLEAGRNFHSILEREKAKASLDVSSHPEDELHNRMVGATVLMAQAGNVVKAVNFYNEWAVQFGYGPLSLISEQPVVVNIGDAIVGVEDGRMVVMRCL